MDQITEGDFAQLKVWDEEEIDRIIQTHKTTDDILKGLRCDLARLIHQAEISGVITGAMTALITAGMSDKQIIEVGRRFFLKRLSPSVPVFQYILKQLDTMPLLPNDEDDFRGIRLAKKICRSLIKEFGVE